MIQSRKARYVTVGAAGLMAIGLIGGGVVAAQEGDSPSDAPDGECNHDGPRNHHGATGIRAIIDASGLEASIFADGFESGMTVNEVLADNGADSGLVLGMVLADLEAKLSEKVSDATMTQEQADEALANAETIGISVDELKEALQGGSTIADVAVANGSSARTVVDAMVSAASDRIDQAVADGNLDAEKAAEMKSTLTDRITELVNNGRPERPANEA